MESSGHGRVASFESVLQCSFGFRKMMTFHKSAAFSALVCALRIAICGANQKAKMLIPQTPLIISRAKPMVPMASLQKWMFLNGSVEVTDGAGNFIGHLVESSLAQFHVAHDMSRRFQSEANDERQQALELWGHRMLALDPPFRLGNKWSISISWRPVNSWMHPSQTVLAFAKSTDGSQGMLLLTTRSEIGVWTEGQFFAAPFDWQDMFADGNFHELEAEGSNGSTIFRCDGFEVARVRAQPRNLWLKRIGGDADCGKAKFQFPPQGVGQLHSFKLKTYW
eukprot:TRINITY_DN29115_c0_g1_i1.p1 TRINITY_DN29115_c0_g1~~TRINITY_DN29115_c0_g1_i1.p1  ORF type:complete len:280 (+),score=41.04 TRINITY_DN29115_c0_g1_i1:144-983(+)